MDHRPHRASLPKWIARSLAAQSLRALASTQGAFLVGLHFGWLLIILAALTNRGVRGEGLRGIGEWLLRGYVALGGADASGHGGLDEVMVVWGKVSLAVYVVLLVLDLAGRRRRRWGTWRKITFSTAVAAAGYGFGFGALNAGTRDLAGALEFAGGFTAFTFVASAWAFGVAAFLDKLGDLIGNSHPRTDSLRVPVAVGGPRPALSVGVGAVLLAAGAAAGLALPGPVAPPVETPYEETAAAPPPAPPALPANTGAAEARARCSDAADCGRRCAGGAAAACGKLAELTEHGLAGASKDAARAAALTAQGCELGDGVSCVRRAASLEAENVPARIAEAVQLYRRACELVNADGCAGVAYVYEGRVGGPPPDGPTAKAWFGRACELGLKEACARR